MTLTPSSSYFSVKEFPCNQNFLPSLTSPTPSAGRGELTDSRVWREQVALSGLNSGGGGALPNLDCEASASTGCGSLGDLTVLFQV